MNKLGVLSYFLAFVINTSAQVPEVKLKNASLLKAIDMFLDSAGGFKLQTTLYVVTVTIRNMTVERANERLPGEENAYKVKDVLSYTAEIAAQANLPAFKHNLPSFRFAHRDRQIYVFTGSEKFIETPNEETKRLQKSIERYLPKGNTNYSPSIWVFQVKRDSLFVVVKRP